MKKKGMPKGKGPKGGSKKGMPKGMPMMKGMKK